ncbi:hypothetical protein V6N12_062707 [Hibiscus sabdariffa]|uniref:Uncharacterized protein n=1 Tax=Hibiscus sabdariffa TaxID=183260 RepID=A0ABR2F9M5_9ROSI
MKTAQKPLKNHPEITLLPSSNLLRDLHVRKCCQLATGGSGQACEITAHLATTAMSCTDGKVTEIREKIKEKILVLNESLKGDPRQRAATSYK